MDMTDSTYRDADSEAATLGRKRKNLARWWRPLLKIYVAGTIAFIGLLFGNDLSPFDTESLNPWGVMLIASACCLVGAAVPLLIMIPIDVYWDRQMRRAFHRRNVAKNTGL